MITNKDLVTIKFALENCDSNDKDMEKKVSKLLEKINLLIEMNEVSDRYQEQMNNFQQRVKEYNTNEN